MWRGTRFAVFLFLSLTTGCGLFGGSDGGAPADLAPEPVDLTLPDDRLELSWFLLTAQLQSGTENGFAIACDDPRATISTLAFTVENRDGDTVTTEAPCPAGSTTGRAVLDLPDDTGPFTITAVARDRATSRSEHIRGATPRTAVTIRIYAFGCDSDACTP